MGRRRLRGKQPRLEAHKDVEAKKGAEARPPVATESSKTAVSSVSAASSPAATERANAAAAPSAAASLPTATERSKAAAAFPAKLEGIGPKARSAIYSQAKEKLMKRLQRKARDNKVKLEMSSEACGS